MLRKTILIFLIGIFLIGIISAFNYPHTQINIDYSGNITNLSEMQDTNILAPNNEDILIFNTATNKWETGVQTEGGTDCSVDGSCSNITYLDYSNAGNLNVTSGNDFCIEGGNCLSNAGTGSGDITEVLTSLTDYLSGGSSSGSVSLNFNETKINNTIDSRAGGGTDDQILSWNSGTDEITIESGNTIDISSVDNYEANTDSQTLSTDDTNINDTITISNGNTITINDNYETDTTIGNCSGDGSCSAVFYDSEYNTTGLIRNWSTDISNTNNYVDGVSFSGTDTKTLTLTRNGLNNLTTSFTDRYEADTDTIWVISNDYLINNSGILSLNETKLNQTIDARDNYEADTNTNCSASGSCNEVAYLDYSNAGNLNVTSGNDFCIEGGNCLSDAGTGSGDITDVLTDLTPYLSGGSTSGSVSLNFNETKINNTIDNRDDYEADTNESTRFNNLIEANCPGTLKMVGVDTNGNVVCESDVNTNCSSDSSCNTIVYTSDEYLGGLSCADTEIAKYNSTSNVWECATDLDQFEADTNTEKSGGGIYLYNDTTAIYLNETQLNQTIDSRDSDTTYTAGSNLTLNGDEFNWDSSWSLTTFIKQANEGNLNVNSSEYWDNLDTPDDISIFNLGDVDDSAGDLEFLQYNQSSGNWKPISIETTYYNATSADFVAGTLDGGTLDDTKHSDGNYDDISLNFSEVNSVPGLDIRVNFTNISRFNRGIVRYKTNDLKEPRPTFQIWNYDNNKWGDYAQVVSSDTFRIAEVSVYDDSSHIQNGVVQIRLYKADSGKTGNHYYFDWMSISKGFGTPSGQEIDPLSIHRDGTVPLTNNWDAGNYNITADWFFGNLDWSNLTSVPSGLNDGDDYEADTTIGNCSSDNSCDLILYNSEYNTTGLIRNWSYVDTDTQLSESEVENFIDGDEASFSGWDKNAGDDFSGIYGDLTSKPNLQDYNETSLINLVNTTSNINNLFADDLTTDDFEADTNFTGASAGGELTGTYPNPSLSNAALDDQYIEQDGSNSDLNMNSNNVTSVNCITFNSGGSICSA